jgi:hypothetical protein
MKRGSLGSGSAAWGATNLGVLAPPAIVALTAHGGHRAICRVRVIRFPLPQRLLWWRSRPTQSAPRGQR